MAAIKLLVLVIASTCLVLSGTSTEEYYVILQANDSAACPSSTSQCLTLNQYARNSNSYFTTGTTFRLQAGEHYLDESLILSSVSNISLIGGEGVVINITVVETDNGLFLIDSQDIVLDSIEILHSGKFPDFKRSALTVENSQSVVISNVRFLGSNGNNKRSRALNTTGSTVAVINSSFSGGWNDLGGSIYCHDSVATFSGDNSVLNNTADSAGGAVYSTNCTMKFRDRAIFSQNTGTSIVGGVFEAITTNLLFEGDINFIGNNNAGAISVIEESNLTCIGHINFEHNELVIAGRSGSAVFSEDSVLFFSGEINFVNNTAVDGVGGAVYTSNSTLIFEENVTFLKNSERDGAGGAICIRNSNLELRGSVKFLNNSAEFRGGGIYAINSMVIFSNTLRFENNRAISEGGGIGFEGNSQLLLQSPVKVDFYRNQANRGGGMAFIDSNSIAQCQNRSTQNLESCFFQIDNSNADSMDVNLNFSQNIARAGTVLYGGALQLCRVQVDGSRVLNDTYEFLNSISTFQDDDQTEASHVSSDPLRICFCTRNVANCSENKAVSVRRGQSFTLSVKIVGQGNMPVDIGSTVRAYIRASDNIVHSNLSVELLPQSHTINRTCTNITFQLYTPYKSNALILYPEGPCGDTVNTRRMVNITLKPCPPGFSLEGTRCNCERRFLDLNSNSMCDIDTGKVERPANSWVKPIWDENQTYQGFILNRNCPLNFCKREAIKLNFIANNSDEQCSTNRSGILCGRCKASHSLTFKNFHCVICENRYISLVLFFGFAGILLIVILLSLHITVAAGTINGLILYANIINLNGSTFFPPQAVNILTVFISWLNLDFGIETCFFDGLDSYAYTWLQYAFPLYLWVLIGLIIIFCRVSPKVGRIFGSNPVAVFATLILLSYTKLVQTSIEALSFTFLEYPDGTTQMVWLFDGNIQYFKGKHIALAIASIFTILFLALPFTLALIFGPCLIALSGKKYFQLINKFKPLMDAYYGPYREYTRYWIGFTFLIRICLYLVYSFHRSGNSSINLLTTVSVFVSVATIPWIQSERIYEKVYNNLLEVSFILNICLLTTATYHVNLATGSQAAATYISIGVAFVEFIGIVVFHIYLRIKDTKAWKVLTSGKCITELKEKISSWRGKYEMKSADDENGRDVTTTTIELRESLLESNSV